MLSCSPLIHTSTHVAQVARVLKQAPAYHWLAVGHPATDEDAVNLFTACPSALHPEAKHIFGIYEYGTLIGVADILRGFPTPATAYLGLLLLAEPYQGQGRGRVALTLLEETAAGWGGIDTMKLAVLKSNTHAHEFWRRCGFMPTGEERVNNEGKACTLYEKQLALE